MEPLFLTVIFLAFCITVIALSLRRPDIALTAIKTLGRLLDTTSRKSKDGVNVDEVGTDKELSI